MKKIFSVVLLLAALLFHNCSSGQGQAINTNLIAKEFASKIEVLPNAPLIDARTPEEFAKGHLPNAVNYNWNAKEFVEQIATLDKSKPVLIYCLSGSRSSSAASKMRAEGFKEVYELDGGIMKWRAANLPETTTNKNASLGMNQQQFSALLNSDKLVLVDFYADWCAPCKKMKPYLEEISKDMADKVLVVSINADDNTALCKAMNIDALPVLQIYKNNNLTWTHTGYIDKAGVVSKLEEQ